MERSTDRVFRPSRVIALVVIGLIVIGLGYLRFGPGPETVTVPDGAQAGDLTLQRCSFEAENGPVAADCGTLVVPENRSDPETRLIALPVIRVRAQSEHPAEPVFYLEGGPGITNLEFDRASRYTDNRDLVMVGYRGVDGEVRLDCPEVDGALGQARGLLTEATFEAVAEAYSACADRLKGEGIDLAGYGLVDQVDDLEAVRTALGYDSINLLSESAGTRTALIYAWRHPESIHRSVLIGVNPPGHFLWDDETTDRQIGRYADLCSQDPECAGRTPDLTATMRQVAADMPDRWLFLPIHEDTVRLMSFFGIMESTTQAGILSGGGAPFTFEAWWSAAEGDASGLWLVSAFPDFIGKFPWFWGQRAAAARVDSEAALDYFASDWEAGELKLASSTSAYVWAGGRLAEAWPAANGEDEYRQVRTSEVETLLISGALDASTPPQPATDELLPYLPNGHQVILPGIGHTMSFYREQPKAGSRLVNTFLDSGAVDDSLYTPRRIDFTPEATFGAYAKRIVAVMAGLGLFTILTLLGMARRVARRGGFGSKTSAALRSLAPIVLGLGGWFLGALTVLALVRGVPITGPLVVVVSVGAPIGLGLYLAWVKHIWSAQTKIIGLVVAPAGALMGAWLGFYAGSSIFAIVTAILGATAIGNLALLGLDISRDRQARSRVTDAEIRQTRGPVLSDAGSRAGVS